MSDLGGVLLTVGPAVLAALLVALGLNRLGYSAPPKVALLAIIAAGLASLFSFMATLTIGLALSSAAWPLWIAAIASAVASSGIIVGSVALARSSAHG